MAAPVYSASDYAQAMANLLPRGAAWSRNPASTMMSLLTALAPTYERSGAAAANLIPDVSPASTTDFVVEWEETLGLPDACTPANPTLEQRKAAILAKFIAAGGVGLRDHDHGAQHAVSLAGQCRDHHAQLFHARNGRLWRLFLGDWQHRVGMPASRDHAGTHRADIRLCIGRARAIDPERDPGSDDDPGETDGGGDAWLCLRRAARGDAGIAVGSGCR